MIISCVTLDAISRIFHLDFEVYWLDWWPLTRIDRKSHLPLFGGKVVEQSVIQVVQAVVVAASGHQDALPLSHSGHHAGRRLSCQWKWVSRSPGVGSRVQNVHVGDVRVLEQVVNGAAWNNVIELCVKKINSRPSEIMTFLRTVATGYLAWQPKVTKVQTETRIHMER